ncbi:Hpt domain-containing protein [Catenovulum maritimum]|uniref:HPt domain-containing protein n=1 Tax=Catenovulum maritimum TaxID=1513271 RepID=A0A0J8GZ22_9ALTE|nr:Hpt domain-containing protein [Catenovulum maritimum]KMT66494.1 hypothetical protein XM47_02845 [Catenovulum maritimum]
MTSNEKYLDDTICQKLIYDVGNDLFLQLLKVYIEESQQICQKLISAIVKQDLKACELHAHSLKSSSKTYGAEQLAIVSEQAEQAAKSADTKLLSQLSCEITQLHQATITYALSQVSYSQAQQF